MQNTKSVKVALMFSAMGTYSIQIIGFVSIIVIARLLSPAEIGVFAVAGTTVTIATSLSAFGIGQYLIREKNIQEDKIRSVLGMAIILSWTFGLMLILSAPYLADFYNKPEVKNLIWILSVSFFVMPFFTLTVALWKREMRFGQVSIINFVGQLVTSGSKIFLAVLGFSYYGLAIGSVIGTCSILIISLFLRPPGVVWMPKFTFVRSLINFGIFASLTSVFNRASESIPDLVIGKIGTMSDVGLFSRGLGMVLFLNRILISAVAPVVLPHLSEVKRSGGSVTEAYLRSIKLLLAFTWPVFAVASAASYPMIIGLFGDQWVSSVPLASILAIWMMLVSIHSFSGSALIVSGAEKLMFVTGLINTVSRLALVLIVASQGLEMVAWAMVVSGIVEFCVNTMALKKSMGLKIYKMFIVLVPNLFIAFMCWVTTMLIDRIIVFEETNPFQSLAIIAICLPTIWLVLLRITKHEAWDIMLGILMRIKKSILIKLVRV